MSPTGLGGYPANLLVAGRRCVVVGAGRIAARKITGLLDAEAIVHVVAPRVDDEVRALVNGGQVTLDEREFAPSDLDEAWLAITATDDPVVNEAVHDAGEARRIWVNAADDPKHCTFTLASVARRGDLVVTVGTGGRSPALAVWLKHHVESEMGPEFETLLDVLAQARASMQDEGRSTEDADWQGAIDAGMIDLIRAGRVDEAKEVLAQCLSSSSA